MKSLYAQYAKERAGRDCLENQHGFATYTIYKDHVYIEDVYIVPGQRTKGSCSEFISQIENIAREAGIGITVTSISPAAKDATTNLKVVLALGFELLNSTQDLIYFKRRIN